MQSLNWGLCILDEVQVAPANKFKEVIQKIKAHFKLGLTASNYIFLMLKLLNFHKYSKKHYIEKMRKLKI